MIKRLERKVKQKEKVLREFMKMELGKHNLINMHPLIKKNFLYTNEARGKGEDWLSIFKVFKEWNVNSMAVYVMLNNYLGIDSKEADRIIDESRVWIDEDRDYVSDFFDSMEYDPESYKDNEKDNEKPGKKA